MTSHALRVPPVLYALIAQGRWPQDAAEETSQNLRSWIPAERIKRFAPDEDRVYLCSPPFHTIANEINDKSRDFWSSFGALDEIVPAQALIIADFGLGSDSPIVLHFRDNSIQPSVLRLQWFADSRNRKSTHWVPVVESFDEFALMLGLTTIEN